MPKYIVNVDIIIEAKDEDSATELVAMTSNLNMSINHVDGMEAND